jgi:glycine cleavage system regulatory protein
LSSHLAVAEWVTVMMTEVAMKTDNRSALHTLIRTLTEAELHDLLVMVQTEFLNRPAQQDGFAVEVVTTEEAALLGRYRRLPPTQRERLQTIASGAYWIAG